MAWILLVVAGIFEVVWAFSLKQSLGFTKFLPSVITVIGAILSFACLAISMRTLALGTAYTIWTGIGAIGAFLCGVVFLGETVSLLRIGAAGLIVAGILLMKLSSS